MPEWNSNLHREVREHVHEFVFGNSDEASCETETTDRDPLQEGRIETAVQSEEALGHCQEQTDSEQDATGGNRGRVHCKPCHMELQRVQSGPATARPQCTGAQLCPSYPSSGKFRDFYILKGMLN